jgi:hypothetical protein
MIKEKSDKNENWLQGMAESIDKQRNDENGQVKSNGIRKRVNQAMKQWQMDF